MVDIQMSEQVHIRVQEGRRDDWREHAEGEYSEKYGNLSALIRHAVERQIEQDLDEGSTQSKGSGFDIPEVEASNGRMDELLEAVRTIRTDVEDLSEGVDKAVDAVHAQEGVDPDVAPEVFQLLPEGSESMMTTEELHQKASGQFSAAEVRFALENLKRNMGEVKMVIPAEEGAGYPDDQGKSYARHWYKGGMTDG